jgi:hypothetical protein
MKQNIVRLDPMRGDRCFGPVGHDPNTAQSFAELGLAVRSSDKAPGYTQSVDQTCEQDLPDAKASSHLWMLSVIDELERYCDLHGLNIASVSMKYLRADLSVQLLGKAP